MNVEIVRIDRGKDLADEIKRTTEERELYNSWILGGVGAVEDAELGVYNWGEERYEKFLIKEPMELISMQGNVSEEGIAHIHCSLSNGEKVAAGHFFNAKVHIFVEIAFIKTDKKLRRVRAIKAGLKALDVEG
ncbi:MAG: PPC domain-containing DNA-binding protein [Candidatus Thermoplasmatota archaeon]|nr:PPC domain-containing DNA-binding protein [Candidatus Thermoplasmatota archaeon]